MKLASLRNGRPDGHLVLVSSNLGGYVSAGRIAPTLQAALDAWDTAEPALRALQATLDAGGITAQPFDPALALAPLPRAFQWIDGAGYLGQLERVRSVKGGKEVDNTAQKPLLYQGASDSLSGPMEPIVVPNGDLGIDYEAEVCVVTGAVPMQPSREEALAAIRLIGICNDVSLRRLVADDLQHGFGFFHAKPATAFSPVFATPDELGSFWVNGRLLLRVQSSVNGKLYGQPNAGIDVKFDFADLIVAAAQTRQLGVGTIVGSGTVANRHDEALPLKRDGIGFSCIAEARTMEKLKYGRARTPFLADGDRVRIAAVDDEENPVFGIIDQTVTVVGPA